MNWLAVLLAFLTGACAVERAAAPGSDYRISIASGDQQIGASLAPLASPLVVQVTDADGAAVKGVRVRFAVDRATSTTAEMLDSIAVSDSYGRAAAWLRLGRESSEHDARDDSTVAVQAWIATAPGRTVRFIATRQGTTFLESVSPASVQAGDRLTFAGTYLGGAVVRAHFGDVVTTLPGTAAHQVPAAGGMGVVTVPPCVATGTVDFWVESDGRRSNSVPLTVRASRMTLDLAAHESVTLPASRMADCVSLRGDGASYLVTGQFAAVGAADPAAWQLGSTGSAVEAALAANSEPPHTARRRAESIAQREFEGSLRALEQRVLAETRAQGSGPGVASIVAPPALGSLRQFRVVTKTDGSAFTTVTARLRFVGNHVLAYTDTTDNGFSSGQLNALVSLYDRDLHGLAVKAFGAEPDVDGDGRVVVLFTPAVNRLAKREDCVQRGYVTAFFYPVDQLERAANSNRGEIFYAFVPDPTDKYSCTHTEEDVVRMLQPAFLHEMQHLISWNQRVLTRGAETEELWLNEGLSQMAEELGSRLFETRYPAPVGRSTATQLFPDSAASFIAPQMLNAYVYLTYALEHSVTSYQGSGSLEERGAGWLFLRWLADQKGEGILARLVQTSRRGVANVEAVSGEAFGELFGDFSMALFADSLPGFARPLTAPRQRFTTRNLRQLMAREATISGFGRTFPITTYLLDPGGTLRAAMLPGTMMHAILQSKPGEGPLRLSFRTPAGQPFAARLGAQVSILRLPQ